MSKLNQEEQLDQILAVLTDFMRGNFESTLPVEDPTSILDAIHLAINLAGEELQHQRVVEEAARQDLLESEATLRAIGDSAQDAVILMDDTGDIIFWNPAATRIFGWSQDEAVGKDLHQLLVPDRYHEDFNKGFKQFIASGEGNAVGQTLELSAIRKDGVELPVELSLAAVRIRSKWHAVGVIRDISDRKEWQTALQTARLKLAERVQELEETLAHVKTLQGILPICMHCNKIRDDEESWQRIDQYLIDHTDLQISHGLCPACRDKHYPEYKKS